MLIPIRCFCCNKVLPSTRVHMDLSTGTPMKECLQTHGVTRGCCQRMFICHPPGIERTVLSQKVTDDVDESMLYTFRTEMRVERNVTSD